MRPPPRRKGTTKIEKPGAAGPRTRPVPAPSKQNPAMMIGIIVGAVVVLVGVLYAAGMFGGSGADEGELKRQVAKLSSEAKSLLEEGKYADAIAKYQSALDLIAQKQLTMPTEALTKGIEEAKSEQSTEKAAREKWESFRSRAEKPGADKKALFDGGGGVGAAVCEEVVGEGVQQSSRAACV